MFRNSIHTFKNLGDTGLDQVPVNGIIQIIDADNTQTDKVGFIQLIDKTGISSGSVVQDLLDGTVGDYKDITQPDTAGKEYNVESKYQKGDIVLIDTAGHYEAFIAKHNTTGTFDPSAWKNFAEDIEYRGRAWDAGKEYQPGDIVTASAGGAGIHVFIALVASRNADPLTSLIEWKGLNNTRYSVGSHTPQGGTAPHGSLEYPDTTKVGVPVAFLGRPGATWTIEGLPATGHDIVGGPFDGQHVNNNDQFIWNGDNGTPGTNIDDLWVYEPKATVAGEIGGVAWDSKASYQTGAIVSFSKELFLSNRPISSGTTTQTPDKDTSNWTIIDENVFFSKGTKQGQYMAWSTAGAGSWGTVDAPSFVALTDTPAAIPTRKSKVITAVGGTGLTYEDDTLDAIENVDVTTPKQNDFFTYTTGALGDKWVNIAPDVAAGYFKLSDIGDVANASSTTDNGKTIVWNNASSSWELQLVPTVLEDLTDVTYTSLAKDDLLIYTGVAGFENIAAADLYKKLSATGKISDIGDVEVDYATLKDGDTLIWNATTKKWEGKTMNIPEERAGLAWDPTTTYKVGDMASDGNNIFISLVAQTGGTLPSETDANWAVIKTQVQSDFTETVTTEKSFIKNKPTAIASPVIP